MEKIKVKSSHITAIGRVDADLATLTVDAVRGALGTTDPRAVSDIYIASYAPSELGGMSDPFRELSQAIQTALPRLRAVCHGLFKTGGHALHRALEDAAAGGGPGGDIIVVGVEKMTHIDPPTASGILARRESPHDHAYGATLPALGGIVTRRYLDRHDVPQGALDRVAIKNHANAVHNPIAQFRRALTVDEVAASPLVCDPLRRLHCAPTSDGAAALRLAKGAGPVTVRGWGAGLDAPLFQDRTDIERFVATRDASAGALAAAGVDIKDIDVVEIHDAFASFELINLEEMGFYELGTGWRALEAGELVPGGRLAVNASGGMKARGHPIGAAGLTGAGEVFAQLTGCAGARQHPGARLAMVQAVGGVSPDSFVFVFEAESRA